MLVFALVLHVLLLRARADQLIFGPARPEVANANRIFNQMHGALKSWWTGHAQINRAVMPATIVQGTQVWHSRPSGSPPETFDYFSMDVDHSWTYAALAYQADPVTLWHYTTKRPLKVLYFDGQSAAKSRFGVRDLQQHLFLGGIQDLPSDKPQIDDRKLAQGLCEWSEDLHVDGFVRQESLYEIIICHPAGDALHLNSQVNMTAHYSPPGQPRRKWCQRSDDPYASQMPVAWAQDTATHYQVGETRIKAHPEHLVSLYEEAYQSLTSSHKLPLVKQRLTNMSHEDVDLFRRETAFAVAEWHDGMSSGNDWTVIGQVVHDRYAARLADLRQTLVNTSDVSLSMSKALNALHNMIYNYLDASVLSTWPHTASSEEISGALARAANLCTSAYTGALFGSLNKQERLLKDVVEAVNRRICHFAADAYAEALVLQHSASPSQQAGALAGWQRRLTALMDWLDWPTWVTCDSCAADQVCFLKLWPISTIDSKTTYDDQPAPRCVRHEELRVWFPDFPCE